MRRFISPSESLPRVAFVLKKILPHRLNSHVGTCHCNMAVRLVTAAFSLCEIAAILSLLSQLQVPATHPLVCIGCDFVAAKCRSDMCLQHIRETCPRRIFNV